MLLALRGRFRVNGEVCTEAVLRAGLDIEIHEDLWLHCDEVVLPSTLPGLRAQGLPTTLLTRTTSLFVEPVLRVQPGYHPDADVIFWTLGDSWSYRVGDLPPRPFDVGCALDVRGVEVAMVSIPVEDASRDRTRRTRREALRFEVTASSVRVAFLQGNTTITGVPGKLLATLAMHREPCNWEEIASTVWEDEVVIKSALRRRFDVGLMRLREKMHRVGLPTDLIKMDGFGEVVLALSEHDRVISDQD